MKIEEILTAISRTSSKTEKERLFRELPSTRQAVILRQIYKDTYDPDRKYRATSSQVLKKFPPKPLPEGEVPETLDDGYDRFHGLLDMLADGTLSGHQALRNLSAVLTGYSPETQQWLCRILDKDLKIGLSNTFAKNEGTIKKLPVALATDINEVKAVDILDGNWFISRKLDGCRCLTLINCHEGNTQVQCISRQGKEFETLDRVSDAIRSIWSWEGAWVLDGEICLLSEDGSESFKGIMKEVRRKNHTIENPAYMIFDILTYEEFLGLSCGEHRILSERYKMLEDLRCDHIEKDPEASRILRPLEQKHLMTQADLDEMLEKARVGKWEGLIARKNILYEGKRSKNMLKIKDFKDAEYVVEGIEDGDMTFNSVMGSETFRGVTRLIIRHKGNTVGVGSGMSKAQRQRWLAHPEEIIGKTITVKYFEETEDKDGRPSLRFPTLKYVYENGRDV